MAPSAINQRIADRLLEDGYIEQADHSRAVGQATRKNQRIEEVLLELGIINEPELLKYIATLHKTQFVSTERLSKARIDRKILAMVARQLAQQHGVYPLIYDRNRDRLIVAMADPDNLVAQQEIRRAARVGEVKAMVARPTAIFAAIRRGYDGERNAFKALLASDESFDELLLPESALPAERPPAPRPKDRPKAAAGRRPRLPGGEAVAGRAQRADTSGPEPEWPPAGSSPPPRPVEAPRRPQLPLPPKVQPAKVAEIPQTTQLSKGVKPPTPPSKARKPLPPVPPPAPPAKEAPDAAQPEDEEDRPSALPPMSVRLGLAAAAAAKGAPAPEQLSPEQITSSGPFIETLRVLIGLLDADRNGLRGHSAYVAELTLSLCERINLPRQQTKSLYLASYLHDLGKMGTQHLTALNVAQFEHYRESATKLWVFPEQLMEAASLPKLTLEAVGNMYEQVNGSGFPAGLSGKDIPMGARILAVTDSYADLTKNRYNTFERPLKPEEAIDALREHAGTIFDSNIIEVLEKALGGEKILSELAARPQVLIVDPDPEDTMVLQLRLVEQGFEVHLARSSQEARAALMASNFAMVLCEVDLEEPDRGLFLREELAGSEACKHMGWVFLSGRGSSIAATRAFELDVDDFISKPVASDIVVAKIASIIRRRQRRSAPKGVAGSLSEMGLPEIVQVLWHGRKTCSLHIEQGDKKGEIHFDGGRIVQAIWEDAEGEKAFYRMVALKEEGQFWVDPGFAPTGEPTIKHSPEGLLLESMRLMDEGAIP